MLLTLVWTAACENPFLPELTDPVFTIDLRYWDEPPTPEQQESIGNAVARWEGLIAQGLPEALVTGDAGCGPDSPLLEETVNDVVVFIRVIDLPALAESGPCKVRSGGLPITATVWIDGPSRINQLSPDFLESLVTHELGHALGFGTLWDDRALLRDPSLDGGDDPHFIGPNALAEFNAMGGSTYNGNKVPVESVGGPGTADSHWREFVFGERELMSRTVLGGANPLSRATAASMIDLGYDVDLTAADPYVLPGRSAPAVTPWVESLATPRLTESQPRWTITVTDPSGRIVR